MKSWTMPLLCSNHGPFDMRAVPFSRRGAFLCVLHEEADNELYLSISRTAGVWLSRKDMIKLQPLHNGQTIAYTYTMEIGKLVVETAYGLAEMCFDEFGNLRVRLTGISFRMTCFLEEKEYVVTLNEHVMEADFRFLGKFRFVSMNLPMSAFKTGKDHTVALETCVPETNAVYEISVLHTTDSFWNPRSQTRTFYEIVHDAEENFWSFATRYMKQPKQANLFDIMALWTVWSHTVGPKDNIKHEVVLMTRTQWVRAFGWQQSYHSMAIDHDAEAAWDMLQTMFDYQDAAGQLPDSINDIGAAYLVTKPALQGLAFDVWSKRYRLEDVPYSKRMRLYIGFSKFAAWWLVNRDRNHTGMPQYFHADESPGEFCSCFAGGIPLMSSDLTSFVILLCEACAKLASSLQQKSEAYRWEKLSQLLLQKMIVTLWDGKRFIYRVVSTGQTVNSRAFMSLIPVILGHRLPAPILERLAQQLADENAYLLKDGVAIEHIQDADNLADTPGPKGALAYISALMCIGLKDAGYTALAEKIARRACSSIRSKGFTFITDPNGAENRVDQWTSWSASCYIILKKLVNDSGEKTRK